MNSTRTHHWRRISTMIPIAAALLVTVGCMKRDGSPSYAEESYGDYGGGGGMETDAVASMPGAAAPPGYDFDDGMAAGGIQVESVSTSRSVAPAPMADSRPSAEMDMGDSARSEFAFARGSRSRSAKKSKRMDAPSPMATSAGSGGEAAPQPADMNLTPPADTAVHLGPDGKPAVVPDDQTKQVAREEEEPEDHGRQIIYTAGMTIGVWDVDDAMEKATRLPDKYGGYVHMSRTGYIMLKIPARRLRAAMDDLQTWGLVQARQLQAQDVTAEFTDLESRIRVLRQTQLQLIDLLKQAKTVEEALHVRKALDDVTMQLETALGRMRQLGEAVSFSTLTVQFNERTPMHRLPSSNDPFRWVDSLGVEGTQWR